MLYKNFSSGVGTKASYGDLIALMRNELAILISYRALNFVVHTATLGIAVGMQPYIQHFWIVVAVLFIDIIWIGYWYVISSKRAYLLTVAQRLLIEHENGRPVYSAFRFIKECQNGQHRDIRQDEEFKKLERQSYRRITDKFMFAMMLVSLLMFACLIFAKVQIVLIAL